MDGDRIWKNLRRFSGWMFVGCVAAAVAFCLNMQWKHFAYALRVPGITPRRQYELLASASRHFSGVVVLYSVHLLCVIYALNTLLRRVSDHASHSYYNTARDDDNVGRSSTNKRFDYRDCIGQYKLYYWVRSMHVIAMVMCALNVVVTIVAAGFSGELTALSERAAAATALDGSDTDSSLELRREAFPLNARVLAVVAISQVIEPVVLVFVTLGYILFFPASLVMFRRIQRKMQALIDEMSLRTDQGNAFLPFEFSPRAADGSATQTEMPIVDARKYLRDIKSSAAAQFTRFRICLSLVRFGLFFLAVHSCFVVSFAVNQRPATDDVCTFSYCDASCQTIGFLPKPFF